MCVQNLLLMHTKTSEQWLSYLHNFFLFPQNKILRPFAMSSFAATINVLILFLALRDDEMGETDDDHGKRFKTEEEEKNFVLKNASTPTSHSLPLSLFLCERVCEPYTYNGNSQKCNKKERERERGGKSRERERE